MVDETGQEPAAPEEEQPTTPPPVQAEPPTPPPPPAPPTPGAAPGQPTAASSGDDPSQEQPILAVLSYIFGIIVPIIILVTDMKKSRFMRLHAFNALFLQIAYIVVIIALQILSVILAAVTKGVGGLLGGGLIGLVALAYLIIIIISAVKANGKDILTLPVITDMATKQADK